VSDVIVQFLVLRRRMLKHAIHVYVGLLDAVDTTKARAACLATLSLDERQHLERFAFVRHRLQYLFAHGLLRIALSRHVPGVEPASWRFLADKYGRPFAMTPLGVQPIHFNLSHTEGCVACVVSPYEAVGIDVESTNPQRSLLAIAERTFSPEE